MRQHWPKVTLFGLITYFSEKMRLCLAAQISPDIWTDVLKSSLDMQILQSLWSKGRDSQYQAQPLKFHIS